MTKKLAIQLSLADWAAWCQEHGQGAFRAQQIVQWMYLRSVFDPALFSNLSASFRQLLAEEFDWSVPLADTVLTSKDGSQKVLLKLHDNRLIECVLMPSDNRVTLCISSQVGCKMGCTFCQTGKMGLERNLSMGEIVYQVTFANALLQQNEAHAERHITNIVFMGMGEPLDNYGNVIEACQAFVDKKMFGISKHKVTVSTSGLIPAIEKLGHDVPVALAISLHSADDEQRSKMMPINKKYPLTALKKALLQYPIQTRHGITFEYVMIKGVNDSVAHAKKLVQFLHGIKAKVNLIPMNSHPGANMLASHEEHIRVFQSYLSERSIPAPVRYSRGQDISAACGQLAAKRKDELHLPPRTVALQRRQEYLAAKSKEGVVM